MNNNIDNSENLEPLPEVNTILPDDLLAHANEMRHHTKDNMPVAIPKNMLLTQVINVVEPYDYIDNMETSTPDTKTLLRHAKNKIRELKTAKPEGWELEVEDLETECHELRSKMKIPDLKIQYRILALQVFLSAFEKVGYPIVWMKGNFHIWNGIFYSVIEHDHELRRFLRGAGTRSGVPKRIIEDIDFITKMETQFISTCSVSKSKADGQKILVNLLNGTLEINEDEYHIRPHNPNDYLTYVLPFCFDPNATAPLWKKHLNRVLPDETAQKLLAEHFGYTFIPTSRLKLEKVLVLYGSGANGKSVVHDVITKMLGEANITHYSLDHLCDKTGYYRAMIDGKLLNYCSEISSKMNLEYFKKLASGEPVDVRSVYQKPYLMEDYPKLVFNCNELPWTLEHNIAFFRRLSIIPFNVTIPEGEQDKELANKIVASELAGVFNWVLLGMTRLARQKKFTFCEAVQEQVLQFKKESDSVQLFIEETGYVKDSTEKVLLDDVFTRFCNYCTTNKYKSMAKNTFGKRLRALGFEFCRNSRASYVYMRQDGYPAIGLE